MTCSSLLIDWADDVVTTCCDLELNTLTQLSLEYYICGASNTFNQFPLLSMITTLDITNIPQIMTSITAVMPGVSIDQLVTAPAISLIWLRVDILGFPWQPWHHPDITSGRIIREHCEVSPWQCRSLNGGEEKSSELYQSIRLESSSYFVGIK